MNVEHVFDIILIILKIIIVSLWIIDIYLKYAPVEYRFLDINDEQFWQKRISVLFEILIAFLLIYLFNPLQHPAISKPTKFTLFMFGFLIIARINWTTFVDESLIVKYVQRHQ
jgi:hypothetical protein